MSKVIVFASSKGGAGKTTSALILATGLASRGYRVGLIDADPNQQLIWWRAGVERPLPETLTIRSEINEAAIVKTINQVEAEGAEFVIVDLEGTGSRLMMYALSQADLALIPCQGSQLDALQAGRMIELLNLQKEAFGQEIPYRIVLTQTGVVKTRSLRGIEDNIATAGLDRLPVDLLDREAYRALFGLQVSLEQLTTVEAPNLEKAKTNARQFIDAVLTCLGYVTSMSTAVQESDE